MTPEQSADVIGSRMAEFVATHIGLHFPAERENDLMRGLHLAARDAGFATVAAYSEKLLSRRPLPPELNQLASHLTIGETYFFREEQALRALSQNVLPKLVAERRGKDQHLRLWSAACSTGEEAYSLAILVRELLPDVDQWRITILGTDINSQSLEKAAAGVYGEWSFRTLSPDLRARYFKPAPDRRLAISNLIKNRVTFIQANLAADTAPEYPSEAAEMDVILCRNLLIYFTAEQGRKLVAKLHAALAPGGHLIVSPSELSQYLFAHFQPMNFPGTMLYRKPLPDEPPIEAPILRRRPQSVARVVPAPPLQASAPPRLKAGPSAAHATPAMEMRAPAGREDHASQARTFANLGKLIEALPKCEQWITSDKMDPAAHYLHATVLQELGDRDGARTSLQRCIYLQPDLALAHFALGNLARGAGRHAESQRHYRNAQQLLDAQPQDAPLPESEGLTAGHVAAIVRSLLEPENLETTPSGSHRAFR